MSDHLRLAGKIAHSFIDSKLTPLVITAALLLGGFAIWRTPREEEPQIVVPMLDVMVQMPGASADEVQQRVSVPMEKLLREVPGVEYLYSNSSAGMSLVIVRFYVGTKEEDAIVKTYNKLYSNLDRIPPGVSQPIIKVRSIDDVPILALTMWGPGYDSYRLRRIAGEVEDRLKRVDEVSETKIIGGQPRAIRVVLDTPEARSLWAYAFHGCRTIGSLESARHWRQLRPGQSRVPGRSRKIFYQHGRPATGRRGRAPGACRLSAGCGREDRGRSCRARELRFVRERQGCERRSWAGISGSDDHLCQAQGYERDHHRRKASPGCKCAARVRHPQRPAGKCHARLWENRQG